MDSCPHVVGRRLGQDSTMLDPSTWACAECGSTDSVWACLYCGYRGCGRYDGKHAKKHFETSCKDGDSKKLSSTGNGVVSMSRRLMGDKKKTKNEKSNFEGAHPVYLEMNSKVVYCYICDEYVFNENKQKDVDELRRKLNEIEQQKFAPSLTRSGKLLKPSGRKDSKKLSSERPSGGDKGASSPLVSQHGRRQNLSIGRINSTIVPEDGAANTGKEIPTPVRKCNVLTRKESATSKDRKQTKKDSAIDGHPSVIMMTQSDEEDIAELERAKGKNEDERNSDNNPELLNSPVSKHHREMMVKQDRIFTALCHWKYSLLGRAFNSWRYVAAPSIVHNQVAVNEGTRSVAKGRTQRSGTKQLTSKKRKVGDGVTIAFTERTETVPRDYHKPPSRRATLALASGNTGLRNLGNTCFMNSVLQALSHTKQFKMSILGLFRSFDEELEKKNETKTTVIEGRSHAYTDPLVKRMGMLERLRALHRKGTMECFDFISRKESVRNISSQRSSKMPCNSWKANGDASLRSFSRKNSSCEGKEMEHVELGKELYALLRVLWSDKWAVVTPNTMMKTVWKLIPQFRGYSQQDAQEFLCEFLDQLERELGSLPDELGNVINQSSPKNIISGAFYGATQSVVTCQSCFRQSVKEETFSDLSLEFPSKYQPSSLAASTESHQRQNRIGTRPKRNCSAKPKTILSRALIKSCEQLPPCHLTKMLELFTSLELIDGEIYACENCSYPSLTYESDVGTAVNLSRRRSQLKKCVYREITKQLSISKLPSVLRLHLKRFHWTATSRAKICTKVEFPLRGLDMRPYCTPSVSWSSLKSKSSGRSNEEEVADTVLTDSSSSIKSGPILYDLYCAIIHHGQGFGSGHYTSYCLNEHGQWMHFNDARVSPVDEEEVLKAPAYILLYRQRELMFSTVNTGTK
eukprot:Nk52_evm4s272 gene=Nk52_evmTU4s272